jgi:hypothetical protein
MTTCARLLVSLILLAASFAGVSSAQPEWMKSLGLAWASFEEEAEEQALAEKLERKAVIVQHRLAAKKGIIDQVIDGQISLLKAAALFRALNESPEDCQDPYRLVWRGGSDGEKLCRQVISWTEHQLRGRTGSDGSQATALLSRLEAELQELLEREGTVRLPEE